MTKKFVTSADQPEASAEVSKDAAEKMSAQLQQEMIGKISAGYNSKEMQMLNCNISTFAD